MSAPAPVRSAADPGACLLVEGGDAVLEGVIVDGDREEDGQWDLDSCGDPRSSALRREIIGVSRP